MESLREWFREKLDHFWSGDSETGHWFRRLGRRALVTYFVLFTLYYVATHLGLVTATHEYGLMAGHIAAQLVLGSILVLAMIRVCGRPYVVFIAGVLIVATVLSYAYLVFYY